MNYERIGKTIQRGKSCETKKFNHANERKTRSTESEK